MKIHRVFGPAVMEEAPVKTIRVGDAVIAGGELGTAAKILRLNGEALPRVLVGSIWFKWEDVKNV